MDSEIIKYMLEQSSGVIISLVLITRVESKLDNLVKSLNDLAKTIISEKVK